MSHLPICVKHYHSPKICTIKPKKQILTTTIWIFELPTSNNMNYQVSPRYHKVTCINNGIISYTTFKAIFAANLSTPSYVEDSESCLGMSGCLTIPQEARVLGA